MLTFKIIINEIKSSKFALVFFIFFMTTLFLNIPKVEDPFISMIIFAGISSDILIRKINKAGREIMYRSLPISSERYNFILFTLFFVYPVWAMILLTIKIFIFSPGLTSERISLIYNAFFFFINIGSVFQYKLPHTKKVYNPDKEYNKIVQVFLFSVVAVMILFVLNVLNTQKALNMELNVLSILFEPVIYLPIGLFSIWANYRFFKKIREKFDAIEFYKSVNNNWYNKYILAIIKRA